MNELHLRYGNAGEPLFAGVSLSVDRGAGILVRGPSGSGKSSLLRSLVGLEAQAQAELLLDGHTSSYPLLRRQMVYVAQESSRLPMTIEAALRLPFGFGVDDEEYSSGRARKLFVDLGLPEKLFSQEMHELSGGEAKRVSLVRALLLRPKALILDEPAANLDEGSRDQLALVLEKEKRERDVALVIASHDEKWCDTLCDTTWSVADAKVEVTTQR